VNVLLCKLLCKNLLHGELKICCVMRVFQLQADSNRHITFARFSEWSLYQHHTHAPTQAAILRCKSRAVHFTSDVGSLDNCVQWVSIRAALSLKVHVSRDLADDVVTPSNTNAGCVAFGGQLYAL